MSYTLGGGGMNSGPNKHFLRRPWPFPESASIHTHRRKKEVMLHVYNIIWFMLVVRTDLLY